MCTLVKTSKGTSNAAFSYRAAAKGKGYEDLRVEKEEIGYTDRLLFPDPNVPQIPIGNRTKRLAEVEKRKKVETEKNLKLEIVESYKQ
jgi:hypothetical protein